jgi:5-methylcytosine-specific restriction endonuclease McrA
MENERVLLLNASYEPIRIISLMRAIILMVEEKVDVVESAGADIRSPSMTLPRPSVLRLKNFVKIPLGRKDIPLSNRAVFSRDRYTCAYCMKQLSNATATVDHIQPRSKGGQHEWENVITSCKPCNSKKGNKLLKDLPNYQLNFEPYKPTGRKRWLVIGTTERETWGEYLEAFSL